ncbi:NUDIX domain-containing protein [Thioclava atlantica]|uniref:NUDIX domain-containing protein n=1 Tax=Thioclava atlantica TaxID=1317124 RepID=UPI00056E5847|nr:NUDIX domain-containing protein [Thioclava atlantica]
MIRHFFYGTLCHPPLLEAVIGRVPALRPARLPGFCVHEACRAGTGLGFPVLVAREGAETPGLLADLTSAEAERIAWYEAGYDAVERAVEAGADTVSARIWLPQRDRWEVGAAWTLSDWAPRWAALKTEGARRFVAEAERIGPEAANARYHAILVRVASALRARAEPMPATIRRQMQENDLKIVSQDIGYAKFFSVEDYHLNHALFAGGMSETLDRAAFVSGDASVVLPYDPVRDRVMLVEQFRMGPMARGEPSPWTLEAIAGRVDPGESPEEAALREAGEEAGITIRRLIAGPRYYPSPGAKTEYVYSYVGLADLDDAATSLGGVADEGEDIRTHLLPFEKLLELVNTGEAGNAPLMLLALWLERNRERLRAEA